jgi:hypothetical protein
VGTEVLLCEGPHEQSVASTPRTEMHDARSACPVVSETIVTASVRVLAGHRVQLTQCESKINEVPVCRAVGKCADTAKGEGHPEPSKDGKSHHHSWTEQGRILAQPGHRERANHGRGAALQEL